MKDTNHKIPSTFESRRSAGARLRSVLEAESSLQIVGTINAFTALLTERAGFLNLTTLENVIEDVRRISAVTKLPFLVDADTGWGYPKRTVREMIKAGAALVLEDQIEAKRCGHRPINNW